MASLKQTQIYGALKIYNTVDENTTFKNILSIDPSANNGKLTFSDGIVLPELTVKVVSSGPLNAILGTLSFTKDNRSISGLDSISGLETLTFTTLINSDPLEFKAAGRAINGLRTLTFTENTGSISGLKTLNFETGSKNTNSIKDVYSISFADISGSSISNLYNLILHSTGVINFGSSRISVESSTLGGYFKLFSSNQILGGIRIGYNKGGQEEDYASLTYGGSVLSIDKPFFAKNSITIAGEDTNQTIITNSNIKTQSIKLGDDAKISLFTNVPDAGGARHFSFANGFIYTNSNAIRSLGNISWQSMGNNYVHNISIGKLTYTNFALNSIAIGSDAGVDGEGDEIENAIAIGSGARCMVSNGIAIGHGASCSKTKSLELPSEYKVYADGIITTSDKQDKTDIKNLTDKYTPFLMDLEPVTYRFNYRNNYTVENPDPKFRNKYGISEYDKITHAKATKANSRIHVGFIAQDVKSTIEKHFPNNDHLDIVNIDKMDTGEFQKGEIESGYERYYMNYNSMIPVLVKVLQEQQEEINILKSEIEKLKK